MSTNCTPGPTHDLMKVKAIGSPCRPTSLRSSSALSPIAASTSTSGTDRSPATNALLVTTTRPEENRQTANMHTASTMRNGIQANTPETATPNSAPSSAETTKAAPYHHHGVNSRSEYRVVPAAPVGASGGCSVTATRVAFCAVTPSTLTVGVQRLTPDVPLPAYAHGGDAGADLVSTEDVLLQPGERRLVGTGLAISLPDGYAGFVHPRSGLAGRAGLGIVNAPGTIDAGYRGEIKVIVINHDRHQPITLNRGDRIAQLVIQRIERAEFVEVQTLPSSVRGTGGHGSTGGASALGEHRPSATSPTGTTRSQLGDDQ